MEQKREKTIALSAAIVLFVVGVICLTAFSAKKPEDPIRIMFRSTAGDVLFDHKEHVEGYGLDCVDCHHEYEGGPEKPMSCLECHQGEETGEAFERPEAFHRQCIECHEWLDSGPTSCSECHIL